jgi:D-alanyl-D-alanine carboxypeptidase
VWQDYLQMMAGMERDLGKRLYIDSGYRSPGRQAYLFIKYLVTNHNYSLQETARWVALPGYSEHGSPERTALDFINADGINGENPGQTAADFENLPEYQWLVQNARRFHFFLSYPRDNPWGVTFEPWHWHWEGELR